MHEFLSILIPVYNEGENILRTLHEIKTNISIPHVISIIYDFEADNTLPVIKNLQPPDNIKLVKNAYGQGVLNAIKTGFDCVKEGVVLVVMADLSDDLAIVDQMYKKIIEGNDIVCGSRYIKGGRQIGGPWFKKCLSKTAGLSLYYLAGIPTHDATNSFKMYTKRVLNDIQIESNGGFELGMEILIKAHQKGYRIAEVPSIWRGRRAGQSRFKLWSWLPGYLRWYCLAFKRSTPMGV